VGLLVAVVIGITALGLFFGAAGGLDGKTLIGIASGITLFTVIIGVGVIITSKIGSC
jgi:hypothetical protein